jgi:hypothetical protein
MRTTPTKMPPATTAILFVRRFFVEPRLNQARFSVCEIHGGLRKPHRLSTIALFLKRPRYHLFDSFINILNHRVLSPLKSPHNKKLNRSGEHAGSNGQRNSAARLIWSFTLNP